MLASKEQLNKNVALRVIDMGCVIKTTKEKYNCNSFRHFFRDIRTLDVFEFCNKLLHTKKCQCPAVRSYCTDVVQHEFNSKQTGRGCNALKIYVNY